MTVPAELLTLTLEREYAATPERLFKAWTDPEELARWFAPNPELTIDASVDLRVGGRYRVAMGPHVVVGSYREIDAPRRLAFTWQWETAEGAAETMVTVELEPVATGRTRLVLRHERLPSESERSNHEQGWRAIFDRLEGLVGTAQE
jgi:uncharacterized protein YndB with AHSA1/START domain